MNPAKRNDKQALRDMTAFAERVKLPIQLFFSEELFRLCSEDSQPPIQGMPLMLFDVLLAVACEFTNHLCLRGRHETLILQLFPRGPEAPAGGDRAGQLSFRHQRGTRSRSAGR